MERLVAHVSAIAQVEGDEETLPTEDAEAEKMEDSEMVSGVGVS